MYSIIPYIKRKEDLTKDNRVPLYIQPDLLQTDDEIKENNKRSNRKDNEFNTNVDFTIKDFDIKF